MFKFLSAVFFLALSTSVFSATLQHDVNKATKKEAQAKFTAVYKTLKSDVAGSGICSLYKTLPTCLASCDDVNGLSQRGFCDFVCYECYKH